MKFIQILACCMATFVTCFWPNAGDWKLVPSPFMILLKWQYSEIRPFLIVDIYHFLIILSSPFQKNEISESWHDFVMTWHDIEYLEQVTKLKRTWNLALVLQIVQKLPENYFTYIYQLAKFGDLRSCGSKHILKNAPSLMH